MPTLEQVTAIVKTNIVAVDACTEFSKELACQQLSMEVGKAQEEYTTSLLIYFLLINLGMGVPCLHLCGHWCLHHHNESSINSFSAMVTERRPW